MDSSISRVCILLFLCFIHFTVYTVDSENGAKQDTQICPSVVDVPRYSGVVPRADTGLSVEEVHLALLRGPLLCRRDVKKPKKQRD